MERILGIDPGTNITGYGIIDSDGKRFELVTSGIIKLDRTDLDLLGKYKRIYDRTLSLITEFKPQVLAIESPFYGKNIQSTLKLGRAQGTVIAVALGHDLPIFEYAPKKVKKSVTGMGNAGKEQVALMLGRTFPQILTDSELLTDMTDAIAVALCHAYQFQPAGGKGKSRSYSSWASFVTENPDRVGGS